MYSDIPDNTNEPDDLQNWTVGRVLKTQAERIPNKTLLTVDGESLSYSEAYTRGCKVANFLGALGITEDDFVAVMLPNSMAFCDAWFGLSLSGAVHVAVNTDYLGDYLAHVLNNSRAVCLIIDSDLAYRVEAIAHKLPHLKNMIIVGDLPDTSRFPVARFDRWHDASETPPAHIPEYKDTACVMYTSGTTGPSKGVLMPHAHLYLFGLGTITHMRLQDDDVFYIVLPMFHANALFMQLFATMIAGSRAVIRRKFSASEWLNDVREHGVTATNSLGVVAAFVLNQAPTDHDQDHSLRVMGLAPISADIEQGLRERFGIADVLGLYGMTEVNIPLYTPMGESIPNSCGRLWDEFYELEIVDPRTDAVIPRGQVGEIVVRPKLPFGFMTGYLNMPDKTIEAWRNFWFHTGDAARMDEQGNVYFIDRIKDCIRRRGENISSFELENTLAQFVGIDELTVYAVGSEIPNGEDEVMVALVMQAGAVPDLARFDAFAEEHLPRFAVPRFVRVMDALPKTPTGKIQKHLLRKEGADKADWDRTQK
ncbi:MAG: AMP-binding protein [Pseudomonadota bacterium]